MDSFHRMGVHLTGPRFLIRKTRDALVKLGAPNALSRNAWLTMTVMGQSITLLVAVKKNMVLECIRTLVIQSGMAYHRGTYGLGLLSAPL